MIVMVRCPHPFWPYCPLLHVLHYIAWCTLKHPVFLDPNVLAGSLMGHTDAVWGLAYSGIKNRLLSCSADGTIKLWNPQEKLPCLYTFNSETGESVAIF